MNLLYIDTEKVWRGGQEQLLGLMIGMIGRGHQVSLAAPGGSLLCNRSAKAGIRVLDYSQRNELSPIAFFKLLKILRNENFELVHLNTPRAIIVGGLAARLLQKGVVFASRRVNFPLKTKISSLKYNLLVDRVLTVSSSIRDTMIDGGVNPGKVDVVYEGIDLDWIDSISTDRIDVNSDAVVVGTVAHLSREKGHHSLLEAVAILQKEFPEARFLIVGDGELRGDLEKAAQQLGITDCVVFTGFRSDSEALMKQFDIFCLPSLSEGLSSAIMAAMANCLPVISTSVGGIPELVTDGVTGYLVTPDSPDELAGALSKLLASPDLRNRMGRAGRERVEENFTLNRKLNQTELSYLELLDILEFR